MFVQLSHHCPLTSNVYSIYPPLFNHLYTCPTISPLSHKLYTCPTIPPLSYHSNLCSTSSSFLMLAQLSPCHIQCEFIELGMDIRILRNNFTCFLWSDAEVLDSWICSSTWVTLDVRLGASPVMKTRYTWINLYLKKNIWYIFKKYPCSFEK